jgi:hypothetical protein
MFGPGAAPSGRVMRFGALFGPAAQETRPSTDIQPAPGGLPELMPTGPHGSAVNGSQPLETET